MEDGRQIRKGAADAIRKMVEAAGNPYPEETAQIVQRIAANGGTPLVVAENAHVMGVIELQDIIKPGISERFERLRKMGIKTVMVTGDNPLTAKFIAEKAGVDDFHRRSQTRGQDELHPQGASRRPFGGDDGRWNE
jgi:K+-transporting ATPase ATPase B chain